MADTLQVTQDKFKSFLKDFKDLVVSYDMDLHGVTLAMVAKTSGGQELGVGTHAGCPMCTMETITESLTRREGEAAVKEILAALLLGEGSAQTLHNHN